MAKHALKMFSQATVALDLKYLLCLVKYFEQNKELK